LSYSPASAPEHADPNPALLRASNSSRGLHFGRTGIRVDANRWDV